MDICPMNIIMKVTANSRIAVDPLLKKIRKKEKIEDHVLKTYEASNPSLYYVYEVMGDYYEAMQQPQQAIVYWQKALKKPIPKLQEKERIQQKIQKQSKDGKES
jgi:tetratricopeptide (TPR) repeat protein